MLNPGSKEAVEAGCICPVLDNHHGRGYLGGVKGGDGETVYVITEGCPLHAPADDGEPSVATTRD